MLIESDISSDVSTILRALPQNNGRLIIAVAGPPAVGKSTIAKLLVDELNAEKEGAAALLPMDGFHLDNKILEEEGTLARKGAPETFDFLGFKSLLKRVRNNASDHYVPTFDRTRDIAIAGSSVIRKGVETVVVEGNYLLMNCPPWSGLSDCFDHKIFVETTLEELKTRLLQRWLDNGYDEVGARTRAESNDIPNAMLVLEERGATDQVIQQELNAKLGS